MRWIPIVLILTGSSIFTANSGTFLDDFHDRNLDGWHVWYPQGFPIPLAFKNNYLVIDTTVEEGELPVGLEFTKLLGLELRLDNSEHWISHTLTCRVRFMEVAEEWSGILSVGVRRSVGQFDVLAQQAMLILPAAQHIQVSTTSPDAKLGPEKGLEGKILREIFNREHLRRPIKLGRWLSIEIVAEEKYFEFHFDDNFVAQYEDETAAPGTVGFQVESGMVVHLDDVKITGPEIPNIGSPLSVNPKARLATTWGEIKGLFPK